MAKAKKLKSAKKEIEKLSLTLVIGDLKFEAKAGTFGEACDKIKQDSFGKIKTKGIFTFKKGGKKAELLYYPMQIKRALFGTFPKDLLEKRLLMLLK